MPFFSRSSDLAPLIVVRTVDRERTIGIYVVIEERETERMFVGRQITVKGGAERLAPEELATVFSAVVENETVMGLGIATSLTRRVRYQQLGFSDERG